MKSLSLGLKNFSLSLKKILAVLRYFVRNSFFFAKLSERSHGREYDLYISSTVEKDPQHNASYQHEILNSKSLQYLQISTKSFPLLDYLEDLKLLNFNFDTCIDIGSGTGWISNILSDKFNQVLAIEPNRSAIEISIKYFNSGAKSNIQWFHGYAEHVLPRINYSSNPIFVVTGVVLSHLPNNSVRKILKLLNQQIPIGSVGLLCEAWGKTRSEKMWHIRPKKFWQKYLSNCDLEFYGPERSGFKGEYLGLKFVKVK